MSETEARTKLDLIESKQFEFKKMPMELVRSGALEKKGESRSVQYALTQV